MKLHSNARTCPNCRAVMIRMVTEEGFSIAQVAHTFKVSRQTVHKWLRRHGAGGPSSLADRSCVPRRIHRKYPPVTDDLKKALFETLHAPPREYGLNRTTWRIGVQRDGEGHRPQQ
jgi:transposase-like protein